MTPYATTAGVPTRVLARARAYLLGRQCAGGGFCFYRSDYLEEPNLHDAWHAVAGLGLLGEAVPKREGLIRFVVGQPVLPQPHGLYYRVRTLCLLGSAEPDPAAISAAVARLAVEEPALRGDGDAADAMERLRLALWLKRHLGLPFAVDGVVGPLLAPTHPHGGFGTPPNLVETRLALSILALCDRTAPSATGGFVSDLADPDFGFRLSEHCASPALPTTCAGIACCRRLGLPIPYAEAAATFVLACQTGDGGFARAPNALPDIGLTHLALRALTTLASAPSPTNDGGPS